MNFLDYLFEESREKELYVLYNTRSKYVLASGGKPFETWAVSPEKALSNILYRLKHNEPDRYYDDVRHNKEYYEIITKDQYNDIMAKREYEKNPEVPQNPKPPQQMNLFPPQMPN